MILKNYGAFRILFYTTLLFTIPYGYLVDFSYFEFHHFCPEKSGVFLNISLTPEAANNIAIALKVFLFFCIVGFFTRTSQWLVFILVCVLNMNQLKFCFNNFTILALIIPLFLWALLDNFSTLRVDDILFKKTKNIPKYNHSKSLLYSIQTYFCIIFFLAGVAKLKYGGIYWMSKYSIKNILLTQNYFFEGSFAYRTFYKIQYEIVNGPDLVLYIISIGTILIELLSPVALFSKKIGGQIVLHLFLLQVGIYIFMYISFLPWLVFYITYLFYAKLRFNVKF